MSEELWTEVLNIIQEELIKTIPKTKKCKKAKWLCDEAIQIGKKRREGKGKGEKEREKQISCDINYVILFMSYLNGLVVFPNFFNLSLNLAIKSS